MGFSEKDDLLPGRISGDTIELIEKFGLIAIILTSVVAVGMGAYYGASSGHHEHVVMALIVLVCLVQFLWIARLYYKDILQERKLVYFSWFVLLLISSASLMYSVNWGIIPPTAEQQALASCSAHGTAQSCYNPQINPQGLQPGASSGCMTFSQPLITQPGRNATPGGTCQIFIPSQMMWSPLFQGNNVSAGTVSGILSRCGLTANHCLQSGLQNATNHCRNTVGGPASTTTNPGTVPE